LTNKGNSIIKATYPQKSVQIHKLHSCHWYVYFKGTEYRYSH